MAYIKVHPSPRKSLDLVIKVVCKHCGQGLPATLVDNVISVQQCERCKEKDYREGYKSGAEDMQSSVLI